MKHPRLCFLLLVTTMVKYVAWKFFPEQEQGAAYHTFWAAYTAMWLSLFGLIFNSREMWLVVALAAGFELQVFACSLWWLVDPWEIVPGQAMCSQRLHFPVGLVGLWAGICVMLYLRGRNESASKP